MVQACFAGWFSLGLHLDLRCRRTGRGATYGPYLDLHLGCVILSVGNNPVLSGEIEASVGGSRGGMRVSEWRPSR